MSATLVIYILSEQDCAVLTWAPAVILGPLRVGRVRGISTHISYRDFNQMKEDGFANNCEDTLSCCSPFSPSS